MTRLFLLGVIVLMILAWILRRQLGFDFDLPDRDDLRRWIDAAGVFGPVLIVALMALAIVATPIPSAPIALVAGAAYGDLLGTILTVTGAEIGALAAFLIARGLGRPYVERHLGQRLGQGLLGSQNMLTFLVFGSRLLPFLSFDMISYAAGLSKLHLWRFAVATLAGIIPASFILAHMGNAAMTGDARAATWTALALGGFTALSLLVAVWRERRMNGDRNTE
ncbi:TVP38/TMEM64 family protein [Pseudaestuariivita atlantica]|uniref:TVP38/TMEM64 family membrane protein n=1 Tax=Pseudaestuariivita atlantica TaxID=1317121 RepID=A0A0L1JUD3_9RHOB|nr:TVP38/TMEM64 family protein [Pseudaestuariivita atlantica]KNG95394.1 membrane protein [Pseudaestuariivita atlantica]